MTKNKNKNKAKTNPDEASGGSSQQGQAAPTPQTGASQKPKTQQQQQQHKPEQQQQQQKQQQQKQQQQQKPQQQQQQQKPQFPPGFISDGQRSSGPPAPFSKQPQVEPATQPTFPAWGNAPPIQSAWGQPQQPAPWGQQVQAPRPQQQVQAPRPQQQAQVPQQQAQGLKKGQQKQQQQRPTTEPTPSTSSQSSVSQPPTRPASAASSAGGSIAAPMGKMQISPTKSVHMIESAPNGSVYEGSRGRRCKLEVNYLQLLTKNLIKTAYHYDVEFIPDIPKKMLSKALDTFMATYFKTVHFAFDGRKNFYTNQLLAVKGVTLDGEFKQEVEAVLGDRSKKFVVKVQFATVVDLSVLANYRQPMYQHDDKPSQAIQCLDVVLRTVFKALTANGQAVSVGRALYFAPQTKNQSYGLGEGMEMFLGLFQSAVLGRSSLYLNVDVAHKAFPSAISVLNVIASFDRDGRIPTRLERWQESQLRDYLKMLSIGYRISPNEPIKTYGFNDLVKSARDAMFVDQDGKKMSVQEYFEQKKKIKLRYPDLPCLHVGSKVRNIYLPLEFCEIPAGQATNKKCPPNCVAQMIKFSATSTDDRKRKIFELLNRIDYQRTNGEIKGFGIDVNKNFQNVEGRVIDPPTIKYASGPVRPMKGVWRGGTFLETQGEPIKWAVVNCDNRTSIQQVVKLKSDILKEARKLNMKMAESQGNHDCFDLDMGRARPNDMKELLQRCEKASYRIVFVIIIDRNDCYAKVKQAAELDVGILTQCIKANTIFRMGRGDPAMTIGNILLKVNAKLNGMNHQVIEPSYNNGLVGGVMFVGGDVTHPSPDQRDIPSVVGVAASYDKVGFRYQCAWRIQDPKQEMIIDLENILAEQLLFYKKTNGNLPAKIMYYRDGVSEGQFPQVLDIEMKAIRGAIKRTYGPAPPAKVTFIVVQKRHHTRFFPTQREFSDGKNNNILAGTVVDKDIVHPFQYQFFMASHAAIQGVTKPTKYCVLINESKIGPDDLQAITYDLCHLFTRCNRSVSYPAPTYYAHLVAARGKQYTVGSRLNMQNLKREYESRLIRPHITNNCPMFFV